MSTSKKSTKQITAPKGTKLRVSQGSVAKKAIHGIELLFRKMNLNTKAGKADKRSQIGTFSVPTKLIEEVAAAADQHGKLLGMSFNSDKAREALAYASAFEPVATKAEAFAQRVRDSILASRSDVGAAALAVYASMKGIVRRPEGAALRDSFDKMSQIMKDRRRVAQHRIAKRVAAATAAATAATAASTPATTTPAQPAQPVQPPPPVAKTDKPQSATVVVNTAGGAA